jgi:predicted Zn-dependent protease
MTEEPEPDSIRQEPTENTSGQKESNTHKEAETLDTIVNKPLYTPKADDINYSISCLRSKSSSNAMIGLGVDIEDGWITFSSDEVGVSEEVKVGKALKKDVEKEYVFSTSSQYKKRISNIFDSLINVLNDPRMKYTWHIIKSPEINAFTAGGYIFITTGIIDFAENDDQLACIIGHEIYHNELGHINKLIRKEKAAQNWFGDYADWTLIASDIAGASFNQENETFCDMYGVDLAIKAGYDGQAAIEFWSRMESGSNEVEKLFSTHPFSEERMDCIGEHLERNYWIH